MNRTTPPLEDGSGQRWSGGASPTRPRGGVRPVPARSPAGFTLLELLVSMAVLVLLVAMLATIISQTSAAFRRAGSQIDAFQSARNAFEMMTRNLSQATLNSHWQYDNATNPTRYMRASDLHFAVAAAGNAGLPGTATAGQGVFFQAPLGAGAAADLPRALNSLLNGMGYYVEYTDDGKVRPAILSEKGPRRFRLFQLRIPPEKLSVYATSGAPDYSWITSGTDEYALPVANNIILLSIWPRLPEEEDPEGDELSSDFSYDSRAQAGSIPQPRTANQLPPLLEITMVAISEEDAARRGEGDPLPAAVQAALADGFRTSGRERFEADLQNLEAALSGAGFSYRVFRSAIPLREAKWSE